jgi:hypothetical protein
MDRPAVVGHGEAIIFGGPEANAMVFQSRSKRDIATPRVASAGAAKTSRRLRGRE